MPTPTVAQLQRYVTALQSKVHDATVVAVRADAWEGPGHLSVADASYRVVFCASPLHVREELIEPRAERGLIVLTPLGERDLGADVVARLAKRRVSTIESWDLVHELFGVRAMDPRVPRQRWLADLLVESAPPGGYDPVPSGVLDLDSLWHVLLRTQLGLDDGRPDGAAVLRWGAEARNAERYRALEPREFRDAVRRRIEETAGQVALVMLDALEVAPGTDLLAMGLAARVLFSSSESPALRRAAVRFERYHQQHDLPNEVGLRWAEAAERLLGEINRERGWNAARLHASRADQLLADLGAQEHLFLGPWSPDGFDQRLVRFAAALSRAIDEPAAMDEAATAAAFLLEHRLADVQKLRVRRVKMALRLVRWLHGRAEAEPMVLADAAGVYARGGAFVDLARLALLGGEQPEAVGRTYGRLLARARERRARENQRFGALVSAAGAAPGPQVGSLVPVERVVEDVLAPLAGDQPVLLLVMDGLSLSVAEELFEAAVNEGWRRLRPAAHADRPWTALAAVPSITAVSRTSLFCGVLKVGNASDERRGFTDHPALRRVSRANRPPVLFHKGDLLEPAGRSLADAVRAAITSLDQKVVGVVLNVVDDLLFKGDQIAPRWDLDAAPLLRELLDSARSVGRMIVVTSDHGHLLDDDTASLGREAGERWREDRTPPAVGEVRVEGPRVLAAGRSVAIVPWDEGVRYGSRRNGYHGGVSPQEMVLPLAVFSWRDQLPAGYVEAAPGYPDWWFEAERQTAPPAPQVAAAPARPTRSRPLLDVLEPTPAEPRPAAPTPPTVAPPWVAALLASERYGEQRTLSAGRGLPDDEQVRKLLVVLAERGGTMTRSALAQKLELPGARLVGFLAASRRLLNVDGLQVLDVDMPSETIRLNQQLLVQQFELDRR